MVALGSEPLKQIDSERNQGRAPDMGWLDHDRLGFNYRLSDIACAIGIAQLGRLELCSRRALGWRRPTGKPWAGLRALSCPARTGTGRGAAGSCSSCSLPRRGPRRHRSASARAGCVEQALPAGDPPDELRPRC
jgi:hypothetical protein